MQNSILCTFTTPHLPPLSRTSVKVGFQGQLQDDEVKGEGNSVNYTYRMHDPRLGRFFAVDPLVDKYPFYSPYVFSGNILTNAVELEGLEPLYVTGTSQDVGNRFVNSGQEYHPKRENGIVVVDNNSNAYEHYLRGKGEQVKLGKYTVQAIKNSDDVKRYRNNLVKGKSVSPSHPKINNRGEVGKLSVDMELEELRTFHLGKMTLDYKTNCNSKECTTTFTVDGQGFTDPNYLLEYSNKALKEVNLGIDDWEPDGKGNNLEMGGYPYDYKKISWKETYKNPGYKFDSKGNPKKIEPENKTK